MSRTTPLPVLLVDHDDSFTYNLSHLLVAAGASVVVRPAGSPIEGPFAAVLIGPGHGRPEDAARQLGDLTQARPRLPILGVCLGHQAIAIGAGGVVDRSMRPVHGERVAVVHDATGIFRSVPAPLFCGRYNSLSVREDRLPKVLEVTARSIDGEVMAIRHRTLPIQGIQFHPESVLSDFGCQILKNWLEDM